MKNPSTARVSLPWKFALLSPMAVALATLVAASRQSQLHDEIRLTTVGNLFVAVGITAQGLYYLLVRKSPAMGVTALMVGSAVFGFGLHTLLRVLGL